LPQKGTKSTKEKNSFAPFVPFCGLPSCGLAAYRVANVFDCFADFPACFAEAFLYVATSVFTSTLSLELIVVDCSTDSFLSFAFCLIQFSLYFVSIR
jgi:hypothetical protein